MILDLNQEKCCYILGFFWADCYFGISSRGIYNFSFEIKTDDFLNVWSYIENIGFENYKTRKRKNSKNTQSYIKSAKQKEMQFFKRYNFDKKNSPFIRTFLNQSYPPEKIYIPTKNLSELKKSAIKGDKDAITWLRATGYKI